MNKTFGRIAFDAFWGDRDQVQVYPYEDGSQEWEDAANAIIEECAKVADELAAIENYPEGQQSVAYVAEAIREMKASPERDGERTESALRMPSVEPDRHSEALRSALAGGNSLPHVEISPEAQKTGET